MNLGIDYSLRYRYTVSMQKRSSSPQDLNQAAAWLVGQATGQVMPSLQGKNPAAVMLGHLGGMKGGKARAERLSPARRQAIARKAAEVRWIKMSKRHGPKQKRR
mgnify:CR=1 FL=1